MYKCLDALDSNWDQLKHRYFTGLLSFKTSLFLPHSTQLNILLGEVKDKLDPGECLLGLWVSAHDMYKCLDELGSDQDHFNHGEFEGLFLVTVSFSKLF